MTAEQALNKIMINKEICTPIICAGSSIEHNYQKGKDAMHQQHDILA